MGGSRALLVVFVKNRTIRIVTGNGLQSTLRDTDCGRIISDHIKPKFRAGDYDEGLKDGYNGSTTGKQP
jgi:uncharacterized protein